MGFKISAAIAIARTVLNDTEATYRYSDADLLEYGNGCLRSLPNIKPDWLYTRADLTCVPGAKQSLSFDNAHALVRVIGIKGGAALTQFDRAALDAFMPTWSSATDAAAQQWAPGDNPVSFYVYPPSANGQILEALYVKVPGPYTADEDTGLPDTITEAVADYIVGMAEARDDEHVLSGRSTQFINQFAARLGGAAKG